ncbi:segregation and condensation protein A [Celerinatantimonas sp. YJH-8]|uniref:segregation and condensation protein A n=1 Tax=Celerinatantimonas sp. YJH-8 TaxID=3228714 RepID=UPI0038C1B098
MGNEIPVALEHTPQQLVLATVNGEPWLEIPGDLYIPPDALEVILERFEGPLDLLLYLIRRQRLNIVELPIVEITRQYMSYVATMIDLKLELAAEYLVMSALLAEIKSRMLLPKPELDEPEEDPRAELVRRLQEYELYKNAAEQVDLIPREQRDFFVANLDKPEHLPQQIMYPDVDIAELLGALSVVLERASQFERHEVSRQKLSTRQRMSEILDKLQVGVLTEFSALFTESEGRMGVIVSFMAILELTKNQLIRCLQSAPLAPIQVTLYEAENPVHGE